MQKTRSTTVHLYPEDYELIDLLQKHFLQRKLRLGFVGLLRLAIRRLAETEGLVETGYKAS